MLCSIWWKIKDAYYLITNYFRNAWRYKMLLANDYDFDYCFLLYFERQKLINMRDFLTDKSICWAEHSNSDIRWIDISIKLITIITQEDNLISVDCRTISKYVNKRNYFRFTPQLKDYIDRDFCLALNELRIKKALHLYNNIRTNYLMNWYD